MSRKRQSHPVQMVLRKPIFAVFFFCFYFLFTWLKINPSLYFAAQEPVFFLDRTFFKGFIGFPGGLTSYATALIAQSFYFPLLGALAITLLVIFITFLSGHFIRVTTDQPPRFVHYIPAVILLLLQNHYFHPFTAHVALLVILILFSIYAAVKPSVFRTVLSLIFILLSHIVAGGFFLLFVVLAVLYELKNKKYLPAGLNALVAISLPFVSSNYLFIVSLRDAFTNTLVRDISLKLSVIRIVLCSFYILAMILPTAYGFLLKAATRQKISTFFNKNFFAYARPVLLLMTTVILAYTTFNIHQKQSLRITACARFGQWQDIVSMMDGIEPDTPLTAYYLNRALFYEGRLLDDMFSFSQKFGRFGLFLAPNYVLRTPLYRSDIYFELGHYNEARHWANEALTVTGETVWNLERLGVTTLLSGFPDAALQFFRKLEKNPIYSSKEKKYINLCENREAFASDAEMQRLSSFTLYDDYITQIALPEIDLLALLQRNPKNKMAFEYLMAYCLLTKKVGMLVKNIDLFRQLGYSEIPRSVQEALLYYASVRGQADIDLKDYQISKTSLESFKKLEKILTENKGKDKEVLKQKLASTHKDTYWYYLLFNVS
jgi:hypothetical protein